MRTHYAHYIRFRCGHKNVNTLTAEKRPIKKKFVMSQAVTGQNLDKLGMLDITFRLGAQILQT